MSVELLSLEVRGFKPFVGSYVVPLANMGVTFIVGENRVSKMADSNGAGKTSALIDALSWPLYDRVLSGTPSERLINDQSETAFNAVTFVINKQTYCVEREQTGRTRRWELFEVSARSRKPIGSGEQVEGLLRLSWRAFINTLLFGQSARFADLSDAPRKQIFDDLLDTALFGERKKVVEDELKQFVQKRDENETKRVALGETIHAIEEQSYTLHSKAGEIEAEAYGKWVDTQADLHMLYQNLDRVFEQWIAARATRVDEQALVDESMRLVGIRTRIAQRKVELDREIHSTEKQLALTLKDNQCPVCRRPVKGAAKEIIGYFDQDLILCEDELARLKLYETDISAMLADWPTLDPSLHHEALRDECSVILGNVKLLLHEPSVLDEARYIRQTADETRETIEGLQVQANELDRAKVILEQHIALREFWVEGFGHRGIKARLLRDYETFLDARLARYASSLTAGEMTLSFKATKQLKSGDVRDEIVFDAVNAHGASCYTDLSSGERQRVDLCLVFALQDLIRELHQSRFSIGLYDEIFEHFDETGCEAVMELLTSQRREFGSVFVISQNPKLLSYPSDHIIHIVKTEKGSAIYVE